MGGDFQQRRIHEPYFGSQALELLLQGGEIDRINRPPHDANFAAPGNQIRGLVPGRKIVQRVSAQEKDQFGAGIGPCDQPDRVGSVVRPGPVDIQPG